MAYDTALITGASSGIGRALALALARRSTYVVVAARRRPELDAVVDEISRAGGRAEPLELDVADAEGTRAAIAALDTTRPLDLVIANAGVGAYTPARDLRLDAIKRVLDVNVLGAIATFAGALPGMLARRRGHLCGVASVAGFLPGVPMLSAYAASKAALISFLSSTRLELHGTGVDVTCVCPGYVRTEMTARNKSQKGMISAEEATAQILSALDHRKAQHVFPRGMAATVALTPFMPNGLYARLVRRSTSGLTD